MAKNIDDKSPITWTERTVHPDELKPYERNPRIMTQKQYEQLLESIQKFGQFRPLLVNHNLTVAGGHQRLKIFQTLGWQEIRITVPSRMLTPAEFKEVLVRDNVNNGQWNQEIVALDFTPMELKSFGVELKFSAAKTNPEPTAPKTIIQYNIIFDDEAQQKLWFDFMRHLREQYPGTEATMAQRITAFLKETVPNVKG